jgi:purine-binding chemotaxis protein CheW
MAAVSPLPKAPAVALGAINLHGEIVAVLDIRGRFGLRAHDPQPDDQLFVVHTGRRRVALTVDEVLGPMEVPSEALIAPEAVLPGVGHLSGAVALPDGLLLIHDLDRFLSIEEDHQLAAALAETQS